jgi:hypothetical protein
MSLFGVAHIHRSDVWGATGKKGAKTTIKMEMMRTWL